MFKDKLYPVKQAETLTLSKTCTLVLWDLVMSDYLWSELS